MDKVWIEASKVKSSVQSRVETKTKWQKVMHVRWLLWVLQVLSQIQAKQRNVFPLLLLGKQSCLLSDAARTAHLIYFYSNENTTLYNKHSRGPYRMVNNDTNTFLPLQLKISTWNKHKYLHYTKYVMWL